MSNCDLKLVWIRRDGIWWVGEKLHNTRPDLAMKDSIEKVQFVKFFGPNQPVRKITDPALIQDYDSNKVELIRVGLDLLGTRESMLKRFVCDVHEAERRIGGSNRIRILIKDSVTEALNYTIWKNVRSPPSPLASNSSIGGLKLLPQLEANSGWSAPGQTQFQADTSTSSPSGLSTDKGNVMDRHPDLDETSKSLPGPSTSLLHDPPNVIRAITEALKTTVQAPKVVPVSDTPNILSKARKRQASPTPQKETEVPAKLADRDSMQGETSKRLRTGDERVAENQNPITNAGSKLKVKPMEGENTANSQSGSGTRNTEPETRILLEKIRRYEKRLERLASEDVDKRKPFEIWNDTIFYPVLDPGSDYSSAAKLIQFLSSARKSIKMCMYLSSYPVLEDLILQKYNNEGVEVHLVTDQETLTAQRSLLSRWTDSGVSVRTVRMDGYVMQDKFLLIDEEALITGSLGSTRQGVVGSQENLVVTTLPRLVSSYVQRFSILWNASRGFANPEVILVKDE